MSIDLETSNEAAVGVPCDKNGQTCVCGVGHNMLSAASCSCPSASLDSSSLPTLSRRGASPKWDQYLDTIYGRNEVLYPVDLQNFQWFYRCDCRVADRHCNTSADTSACAVVGDTWRSSCSRAIPPFADDLVPRVWLTSLDSKACGSSSSSSSFREVYVGVHLMAHVRRNPAWRKWPNPEFRLAPYGMWIYPRPLPSCLANETWVEVLRRREAYEAGGVKGTWYYHAPGSGIWLNTGRSLCVAQEQRDAHWYQADAWPPQVANTSTLASRGFQSGITGIDQRLKSARLHVGLDTMQRNGPFGNMLEIVDVRPEGAPQDCGKAGCTCAGTLRAGWRASRRCRCDGTRDVLNCDG